jgi:hypothetical protein
MSKVVGELKSIKIGNGKTDLVVGETKIGAWHTIKTKTGAEIPNPALAQLEGCKVGDTVEAEVFVTKSGYTNLNGISIQTKSDHVPAHASSEPVGCPVGPGADFERLYLALAPTIYAGVFPFFLAQGKATEAAADYIEKENHARVVACADEILNNAVNHILTARHTADQQGY